MLIDFFCERAEKTVHNTQLFLDRCVGKVMVFGIFGLFWCLLCHCFCFTVCNFTVWFTFANPMKLKSRIFSLEAKPDKKDV